MEVQGLVGRLARQLEGGSDAAVSLNSTEVGMDAAQGKLLHDAATVRFTQLSQGMLHLEALAHTAPDRSAARARLLHVLKQAEELDALRAQKLQTAEPLTTGDLPVAQFLAEAVELVPSTQHSRAAESRKAKNSLTADPSGEMGIDHVKVVVDELQPLVKAGMSALEEVQQDSLDAAPLDCSLLPQTQHQPDEVVPTPTVASKLHGLGNKSALHDDAHAGSQKLIAVRQHVDDRFNGYVDVWVDGRKPRGRPIRVTWHSLASNQTAKGDAAGTATGSEPPDVQQVSGSTGRVSHTNGSMHATVAHDGLDGAVDDIEDGDTFDPLSASRSWMELHGYQPSAGMVIASKAGSADQAFTADQDMNGTEAKRTQVGQPLGSCSV